MKTNLSWNHIFSRKLRVYNQNAKTKRSTESNSSYRAWSIAYSQVRKDCNNNSRLPSYSHLQRWSPNKHCGSSADSPVLFRMSLLICPHQSVLPPQLTKHPYHLSPPLHIPSLPSRTSSLIKLLREEQPDIITCTRTCASSQNNPASRPSHFTDWVARSNQINTAWPPPALLQNMRVHTQAFAHYGTATPAHVG